MFFLYLPSFKINSLGFQTLTGAYGLSAEDKLNLRQLFSAPTEKRGDEYKTLRAQYKNYKENYVKYMKFDPTKPNLSEYF